MPWPFRIMQMHALPAAWPKRAPTYPARAHIAEVQELQKVLWAVSLAEVHCHSSCLGAVVGPLGRPPGEQSLEHL